jgi:hypothetical protein
MNINRTARIASIIEKRRPLAQNIEGVETNLKSLASALRNLEDNRNQLLTRVDDANVKGQLKEIDFSSIQLNIAAELEGLGKLRVRFSRDTLNIGVVGRMKQGKSTLLQSLSGLDNDVIPARKGGACTAVRSTIFPRFHAETEAKITFHSEDSLFKEVILPYYTELGLTPSPASFSDFVNSPLPDKPSSATNEAMYQRLKHDYYSNQAVYRDLLGASQLRVLRPEIQEYVTHANGVDSFKSLAVREVKIYCPFPNPEVGQIALVDIPGLGDLRVGDENLMLETLGQEVDVVLFVRRPDPQGDDWQIQDTALYDTAVNALNDLPERSFLVLNQLIDTQNESKRACERFKQHLNSGQLGIKVIDCIIADCNDPQQANRILDRVLDHLEKEIIALDTKYAESCQERLIQLQSAVKAELDKAQNVFGQEIQSDDWLPLFLHLFNQLVEDISVSLTRKIGEFKKKCEQKDDEFEKQVETVIQCCNNDPGIPSVEDIEGQAALLDGYQPAYFHYLPKIRTHLQSHFSPLDAALKRSIEDQKAEIANILIEQGRLRGLTEARGSEFLKVIVGILPEQLMPEQPSKLRAAFQNISNFSHLSEVAVLESIQKELDLLRADSSNFTWTGENQAQDVQNFLNSLYKKAVHNCENALQPLLDAPNKTAFAMLHQFVDQVLRAKGIEDEWRVFLAKMRMKVWNEFAQQYKRQQWRQKWLEGSVYPAMSANQPQNIQFIS